MTRPFDRAIAIFALAAVAMIMGGLLYVRDPEQSKVVPGDWSRAAPHRYLPPGV